MKEAVRKHATLVGATSGAAANRPTAMDIGSIAPVADSAQSPDGGEAPVPDWPTDESGWPIDEEGNPFDGWIDGQLNFVKGKEKGDCWNCGQKGQHAAQCTVHKPTLRGKRGIWVYGKGER